MPPVFWLVSPNAAMVPSDALTLDADSRINFRSNGNLVGAANTTLRVEGNDRVDIENTNNNFDGDIEIFNDGRLDGGLRRSEEPSPASGVLLVFYSEDLERDVERVEALGATISQPIFEFPGGRRFHFVDPAGTEFAMWSATE